MIAKIMIAKIRCKYFFKFLPTLFLQKLKMGNVYVCSLGDKKEEANGIFTKNACGVHFSWWGAIIKAQSEYVERKAFQNLGAKCTTGFAAYPFIIFKERAKQKARVIGRMEMIERYAWPEWWKNKDIAYSLRNSVTKSNKSFYEGIVRELPFLNFYVILPNLEDKTLKFVITYAETQEGLVCAAAVSKKEEQAEQRALKELYMHAIGLYRMKKYNLQITSLYEKRIKWISKQKQILEKRLSFTGNQPLSIPFSSVFQSIKTEFYQAYVVERCLFEGYQEEFLSTDKEMYI